MGFPLFTVFLCGLTVAPGDDAARLDAAKQAYRAGKLDAALDQLEPLLKANSANSRDKSVADEARNLAAAVLDRRGIEHFRNARIAEAVADFDREVELVPRLAAGHWRRGIACYYAGQYQRGVEQFELHQTVNPQDVENAVWHFLCAVRAPDGSVEKARKNLIPITDDPRVPMREVHRLFAGHATPDDVLAAAADQGDRARFYADLYVGLYYEATGDKRQSLASIERAAKNPAAERSNMGDVARVHAALRRKEARGSRSDK